jgi:hypothetical protein
LAFRQGEDRAKGPTVPEPQCYESFPECQRLHARVEGLRARQADVRAKVAPALREAQTLVQELTTFQLKPVLPRNDATVAWREGPHGDLVLAAGVAAWMAERARRLALFAPSVVVVPGPGVDEVVEVSEVVQPVVPNMDPGTVRLVV